MSRLEQLYQDTILAHNKNPRHFGELDAPTHQAHGVNPLCGDDYHVYLNVENNEIKDISFAGSGCAISKSSASLMAATIKGMDLDDTLDLKNRFLQLLTTDDDVDKKALGNLRVFEGVKKYPVRVKCATLIWRALENALDTARESDSVSTE